MAGKTEEGEGKVRKGICGKRGKESEKKNRLGLDMNQRWQNSKRSRKHGDLQDRVFWDWVRENKVHIITDVKI